MLDRDFAQEFLQTIDDPQKHGVHLLFNSYWRYMPDAARETYAANMRETPQLAAFCEAKWWPEPYAFEDLALLAPGTLGRGYHRHIVDNGLTQTIASGYRDFHKMLEASGVLANMPDDVSYGVLRGFQTHDYLHMVTGFDTTGLGEIALQAFCLAQMSSLYFATWMSVVTARMAFLEPRSIAPLMDAITEGWTLGRAVPNLMVERWETMLDRPIDDIRREYRIPHHRMLKAA